MTQPTMSKSLLAGARTDAWKATQLFGAAGIAFIVASLLWEAFRGPVTGEAVMAIVALLLPWTLTGAAYARLANKFGRDMSLELPRLVVGLLAGASTWLLAGATFIISYWTRLFGDVPDEHFVPALAALLCCFILTGALQGGTVAHMLGGYAFKSKSAAAA